MKKFHSILLIYPILIMFYISYFSGCTTIMDDLIIEIEEQDYPSGNSLESFIPDGWEIVSSTDADFNSDSLKDLAVVIEKSDDKYYQYPRTLMILFQEKLNLYSLSISTDTAIMKADEGGIWGDPFEGLSAYGNELLVNFYGGSNWRWYQSYKFGIINEEWYLIEAKLGSYFTGTTTMGDADEEYYDFRSGRQISRVRDETSGIVITEKEIELKELISLNEFIINSTEDIF